MTNVFQKAVDRAGGACEALVAVNGRWARCGKRDIHVHHMLTRARGGDILDRAGHTEHLICLCVYHHQYAHGYEGRVAGLLIDGYVTYEGGKIVYSGPSKYFLSLYGRGVEAKLSKSVEMVEGVCDD